MLSASIQEVLSNKFKPEVKMQSKNAIVAVHAMASMQDMHIMCALFGTWVNTSNFYTRPPSHAEIKINMEKVPRYIIYYGLEMCNNQASTYVLT